MWCAPEVRCYGGPGVFVFADDGAQFFRSIEEAAGRVEAIDVEVDRAVGVLVDFGDRCDALEEVAFSVMCCRARAGREWQWRVLIVCSLATLVLRGKAAGVVALLRYGQPRAI